MEMFPGKLGRNCSQGNWEKRTEKGRDSDMGVTIEEVSERVLSA